MACGIPLKSRNADRIELMSSDNNYSLKMQSGDQCASRMSQKYLRHMEEKIFHMKIDRQDERKTEVNIANKKIEMYLKKDEEKKEEARKRTERCRAQNLCQRHHSQELFNQLGNHNRFELKKSKSTLEGRTSKMINIKDPEIKVIESKVQMNQDKKIIEIMKMDSRRSITSSVSKRSNSVPPKKRLLRRKNPRTVDLFNPEYDVNANSASAGLSLLESIRTRVFGFSKVEAPNLNEDEWKCDSNVSCNELRFPKETRHAMSNYAFEPNRQYRLCAACAKKVTTMKTSDTQTSPIVSSTQLKKPKMSVIPCPYNLLCDKGIHVGKCEEILREKVHSSSDTKTTSEETDKKCVEKDADSLNISSNSELEGTLSDLEESESMETFLKLMEPQVVSGGSVIDESDPILQLMEPQKSKVHLFTADIPPPPPPPSDLFDFGDKKTFATMNGMNGHANGDLNGCGDIITQNQQKGCWTIGLINSKYRYLTAETFGFKINANGASLKKKQIWTLEPEHNNGGDSLIYLKSHLDKYLAVDSFGNVTCESEEKEPGCQFQISVSEDGSGRWALKNVVRGYFLGSTSDKLTCTAKVPGDAEFWHTHLAARPQVNLRSVGRKRFAHLSENLDEIHVDANIPWGEDTLFTLEFRLDESGKYAIHTCNNKYLSMGGKLVDQCNKDCLFAAEYHSGQLALRDRTGAYLSPIGSKAVLKTRSNTVTKDELFSLEDSLPQASFVASLNSRFVSVKQGVDVTANQDEISDHETFQLEFDWSTKRWYIRTMQDRYWTLETGGGIQASGDKRSSNALFDLIWQGDGSVAFRANNGRYVITKRSGHLYATADTVDDNCKYYFYLINRPILVLKCEQGFVGYKSASSPKLECNKATYECIQVERGEKGVVYFKGQNGKYWHVDSEGVTADSDSQEGFYLELREPTRLCIKSTNGNYLAASKNGLFRLGDINFDSATQWEY